MHCFARGSKCYLVFVSYLSRANVVCRFFGFDHGVVVDRDGSDTGLPIVLDDVNCSGNEYELHECTEAAWGQHNCAHSEDVGLRCCKYRSEIAAIFVIAFI